MGNALMRGRTLNPDAVNEANRQRKARINALKEIVQKNPLNISARRELKWKWGVKLEGVQFVEKLMEAKN